MNKAAEHTEASGSPLSEDNHGAGSMFWRTKAALVWERVWPLVWPLISIVLIFLSLALFDILPRIPALLHGMILGGLGIALMVGLRRVVVADYRISDEHVHARLERDNALLHRPLNTLDDHPLASAGDNRVTDHLWRVHQQRVSETLGALRVRIPSPAMARKDPMALRMGVVLIATLAIGVGWKDAGPRLARAALPQLSQSDVASLKLEVWITPPAYTGMAPLFLTPMPQKDSARQDVALGPATRKPLEIPVGSAILVQISGGKGAPEIDLAGRRTELSVVGQRPEDGGYRGEAEVIDADLKAQTLSVVSANRPVAYWPIRVIADLPPVIAFIDPPKRVGQANLGLRFEARDDFALKSIRAVIRKSGNGGKPSGEAEINVELAASGMGTKSSKGRSRHDYSAHPWAGTRVHVFLNAEDAKGQIGTTEAFDMVLPQRTFNHPVARLLIEQRKRLNESSGKSIAGVISALDDINENPALYFDDTVVFLNIAVARARLRHDQTPSAIESVQKLLWETALRIEDGEFAVADQDLRDAQERLSKAMRDGASPEELDRLMTELQSAVDKYMAALAEHLQRQGISELPSNPALRTMENSDLQRMIERTRELAQTGSMAAAREMLTRLEQILDNIRDGARLTKPNGQMAKAQKMMDDLRGLAQRQQRLLDQTFDKMQNRQGNANDQGQADDRSTPPTGRNGPSLEKGQTATGSDPLSAMPGSLQDMTARQQELRQNLGQLMLQMDEMLGAIPEGLGDADQAMKGAGKALEKGDPVAAVPEQTKALDQLRGAANQAAEQLAKQMQGKMGLSRGQRGQRPGEGEDPFGRPEGGAQGAVTGDDRVKVPNQRDTLRSREILDELHRRAGEQFRPRIEREFIDRLLRRF